MHFLAGPIVACDSQWLEGPVSQIRPAVELPWVTAFGPAIRTIPFHPRTPASPRNPRSLFELNPIRVIRVNPWLHWLFRPIN